MGISPEALEIIEANENICRKYDICANDYTYLLAIFEKSLIFRHAVEELGGDIEVGRRLLRNKISEAAPDMGSYEYQPEDLYSSKRDFGRSHLIKLAISIAEQDERNIIEQRDIIEAFFKYFEEDSPAVDNISWTDTRLQIPYVALTHVIGKYHRELDISFDKLRLTIGTIPTSVVRNNIVATSPPPVKQSVLRLLQKYPNYHNNGFLIMSFADNHIHVEIMQVLKDIFAKYNLNLLRADDHAFSKDLFLNILTYMHGCRFGVAVFERLLGDTYNPNVSFEVGYMYGLNKSVLLLKERTLPRLPSDIMGLLYNEFDILNIEASLTPQIETWLKNQQYV